MNKNPYILTDEQSQALEAANQILLDIKVMAYDSAEEHQYIDRGWAEKIVQDAKKTNAIFHKANYALYDVLEHNKATPIAHSYKGDVYCGGILREESGDE